MKKQFLLLVIISFLGILHVFGGGESPKLVKANKLYDNFAYADAIKLYKELAAQNIAIEEVTKKLAVSYRKVNDMKGAEEWYGKLIQMPSKTVDDIYYYAIALQQNGKLAEAEKYYKEFSALKPNDSRAREWSTSKGLLDRILKDNARFRVTNVDVNTENADFGTAFYGNKIVFASSRLWEFSARHEHSWNNQPFLDLFIATKEDNYTLIDVKHFANEINTKLHEGPATFSEDGNTIYFTRNNYYKRHKKKSSEGIIKLELYTATKNNDGKWINIQPFVYNNPEYSIGHPALSVDGKRLFFVSDMPGTLGQADIWYCNLQADNTWGSPINCGAAINTEGKEMFPFIGKDGTLFFSSDGHVGLGGLDIFMSTPNKAKNFTEAKNLGSSINSTKDDFSFIINKDETKGYFSSNRDGGKGDDDIYAFDMLKKFKVNYTLKGIVVDQQDQSILANSKVILKDATGSLTEEVTTDAKGAYSFTVDPDQSYKLAASHEKYFDNAIVVSTAGLNETTPEKDSKIELIKDGGFSLYGLIVDKRTKEPIPAVRIKVVDTKTNETVVDLTTDDKGDFTKVITGKKMNDSLHYTIELSKDGYLTQYKTFAYKLQKSGVINLSDQMDITMSKLEIGGDLAKMVDIKPIYFDLGKYNIRMDAAIELDKIVKVMQDYPTMVVELGSHTDCRSSAAFNMTLSDNRAKASAAYIISKGISQNRIYGKGYGETKLVNGCACEGAVKSKCSEAEHQQNRRTEFIIVKM